MADFLAVYRLKLFDQLDYGTYVGLWLNLSRVRMQAAYATFRAIKAASAKQLPVDILDAVAASEVEAQTRVREANVKMAVAKVRTEGLEAILRGF